MKIAHIFASYPNKYQPYNKILVAEIIKAGHLVQTFSLSSPDKSDKETIYLFNNPNIIKKLYCIFFDSLRLYHYKIFCNKSFRYILINYTRFRPLLKFSGYSLHIHHIQLVHGMFYNFLKCFDMKYALTVRGSDVAIHHISNKEQGKNLIVALKNAYYIHAVSNDLAQKAMDITGSKSNIAIIPRIREANYTIENKNSLFKSNNKIAILSVGRYHWVKGYNYILGALAEVKNQGIQFSYVICGDGGEEETKQIKYLIKLYGLEDEIVLPGFINSNAISQYYYSADIYICGSLYEGMPNSVINALRFEIPTIATRVGGIPEIIEDHVNGLLCNPADVKDMAEKLLEIIKQGWKPKLIELDSICDNDEIINKYLDFYNELNREQI